MPDLTAAHAGRLNASRLSNPLYGVGGITNAKIVLCRYQESGTGVAAGANALFGTAGADGTYVEDYAFNELGYNQRSFGADLILEIAELERVTARYEALKKCTGVIRYPGGRVYKILRKPHPIAETRLWVMFLQDTGENV